MADHPSATADGTDIPAAGEVVMEPSSGARIVRVTDSSDARSPMVSYTNCASFNQDSTRFVINLDGVATLYSFDGARMAAQKEGALFDSMKLQFDSCSWSAIDPDTMIGLLDSEGVPQIYAYNVRTRSFTLLKDFLGNLPEGVSARMTKSFSDDSHFVFTWRDSSAVVWQHVVLWDRNLDSTYLFDLNDPASGVTGFREAYLDESMEALIVVGDTTRAWHFRMESQADALPFDPRRFDYGAGLQASLAPVYRDGSEGESLAFDWQENIAAIFSTNKHVYVGVRPGSTRASAWTAVSGSAVYYTELTSEQVNGILGFVNWRGHELAQQDSAMLGPGEWHLDATTNRLYVRLPDDSNPLAGGANDNAPVIGEVAEGAVRIAKNANGVAEQLSSTGSSLWERRAQLRGNLSRDKRFFIFNSGPKGSRSDVYIAALNVAAAGMDSVIWTNTINCTALSNSVQKTAGQDQMDDASATSLQAIASGDGFVEFTAMDVDKERWCGLNNSNAIHQSANDINFAIKMAKKKKAWIVEDGIIRAKLKYKKNALFRVAVEGGKVKYYQDGKLIYTSTNAPFYPLMTNASLINTMSSVSNVMISGAGFGTIVSISPAKAALQPNETQQFTVRITGGANSNVTWSATGGTITSTGFYTAPATPGMYTVTAASTANPNVAAFASVQVVQGNDTTPPVISAVTSSGITSGNVTITWTTNEASDTQVEYGLTTAYGEATILNTALVTGHSVAIGGLPANTLIHYRVRSRDASGNLAVSGNFSFTTAGGPDTTPPSISNVASSGVTAVGATITWTTNEASDSLVEFGATTAYGSSSSLNNSMVTSHSMALTGLTGGRLYHYRVKSRDAAGNPGVSGDFTFTTGTGGGGGGGSDVPLSYNAITDRNPRPKPPLPAMGPAGSRITDPTFGSRILRVTDGNTRPDRPARSFGPPSGSEQNTWNVDSTIFFVGGTNGEMLPYSFDKATMTATRMGNRNNGSGGMMLNIAKCEFSFTDKNIIYGTGGNGRTFMQYNFQTDTYTTLFNLDSAIPGLSGTTGDLSASGNERLSTYFGGPVQDSHIYVVVWDKNTGQYAILNTQNSTVKPFGSSGFQPVGTTIGFTLHNARIGKEGRYVVMTPGSSAPFALYVWDTQTNVVAPLPQPGGGGHKVNGYDSIVNHAAPPNDPTHSDAAQWLVRPLSTSQLGNITKLATPALTPLEWNVDSHVSWNNARPNVKTPVLVSIYRDPDGAGPYRAWDDEIIALRTDGVESKAWRICHHRSNVFPYRFDYSPRGNVSQDGRYFSFASNWEKTLGNDEYGTPRFDLFVVELPVGGSSPPPPPGDTTAPVISGVNASGITSSTANVAWTTNEASDTVVEYGTTTAYGSSSSPNSNMATNHSATLTGLTGGRLYHYRVKSRDASGNQGVSGDFTFTTTAGSGGGGGGGGGMQAVAWTNIVNVVASGNSLRNNVPGNGGATSVQRIEFGNGYVEFTATETNTYRWAGLSNGDSGTGYDDVDFAINLTSYGVNGGFVANIHENGVYKGETTYNSGDVFRVAVEGGAVKYYKNGSLIYTSARTPTYPLIVDTAFGETGATITNANIYGDTGLANLTAPMMFDDASRYNAVLNLPVFSQPGAAGLVDWLLMNRKRTLFS